MKDLHLTGIHGEPNIARISLAAHHYPTLGHSQISPLYVKLELLAL